MASNWNDDLAGALEVSSRNGSYFVLDGQHRLIAARKAGVSHLTVIIHEGLTSVEEAARFALLNTSRTRPSAYDIFRARKRAEDPLILEMIGVCHRNGVSIIQAGLRGYGCYAVTALESIAAVSLGLLDQTLRVAKTAWPDDARGVSAVCLQGIAAFIWVYGDHHSFNEARLIEKIGAFAPSYVMQRAKEVGPIAAGGSMGTPFNKAGPRAAIWELWNRHLRNPLPLATLSDMKQISLGRNPWASAAPSAAPFSEKGTS